MIKRLLPRALKSAAARFLQARSLHVSQAGQDYWVWGEAFNEKRGGWFVDVGAHDGVFVSNTLLLEQRFGWNGLCVEGDPDNFALLRRNRRVACVHACLDAQEGTVEFAKMGAWSGIVTAENRDQVRANPEAEVIRVRTRTLASVLAEHGVPPEPDYLSMDIEGAEERVLAGFDFSRHRFKCLTIERPSPALRETLRRAGYLLVRDVPGLDAFYVHGGFVEEFRANLFNYYMKRRLSFRWR